MSEPQIDTALTFRITLPGWGVGAGTSCTLITPLFSSIAAFIKYTFHLNWRLLGVDCQIHAMPLDLAIQREPLHKVVLLCNCR